MKAWLCMLGLCLVVFGPDFVTSVDFISEKDYDSELDDELDVIQDLEDLDDDHVSEQYMIPLFDTSDNTVADDFDLRSLFSSEDDTDFESSDVIDEFNDDEETAELERELMDQYQEDMEQDSLETKITNMLNEVLKKYKISQPSSKKGKCSTFKYRSHTTHNCTNVKTLLGEVTSCRISCKAGYYLKHVTPYYELCGAPTKWRWTYQLRGDSKAGETCIKGKKTEKSPSACTDAYCYATAAYYMNKIDYTVNPCDDFFEYSCGRWLDETNFLPASKGRLNTYAIIRKRVKQDMAKLLAKPVSKKDISSVKKTKIIYESCMNMKLIDKLGSKPILKLLKGHLEWPVISKTWKNKKFSFESTYATLRGKYNNNIMFTVRVGKNYGTYILQTWKGKTGLPGPYLLEERFAERKAAYFSLMVDIAVMLGADKSTAYDEMRDVLKFEEKVALLKTTDADYWTESTIANMKTEIPGIDWLKLFKKMVWNVKITSDTKIAVWNVAYLKDMVALIKKTDKRIVQNYMIWRLVKHRIQNLGKAFEERNLEFENALYGTRALHKRWYKCSLYLIYAMQGPTGKMFVDSYFSPSKKKTAEDMFNNIRNGFIYLLKTEVTWMDKKTKAYAKEKAKAIKAYIGYNSHIYENTTYLNNEWKHLNPKKKDYFGNVLKVLTSLAQNDFKKLTETYSTSSRGTSTTRPTMVNAFYSPTHNTITLPAGEMQYPFYWGDKFPRMFQYGAIGTILGHEITHGFDNHGALRGKYGHLKNWWSSKSWHQFHERTQCMEDQYSNYYWDTAGEYINGKKTLSENIADNGGIREAYRGYQIWLKKHNITGEAIEPATGLTNNQMFFVGFANIRCAKYTHKAAVHSVATSVHSPGRFRVIGSLQNFDKFAEAFSCPDTTYMNPKKKCIIW